MKFPANTEPFLWGTGAGAIALAVIGFNWGGWMTEGTAQQRASAHADKAVVASLTPICVAQFRKDPKSQASLAVLKGTDRWDQVEFINKGGWAMMPGSTAEPSRDVADACAQALVKPTV